MKNAEPSAKPYKITTIYKVKVSWVKDEIEYV